MKRNRLAVLLAVLMAAVLMVTACGEKPTPKEAVQGAWTSSMEMKSFTYTGTLRLEELDLPPSVLADADASILAMLKNMSVGIRGAYSQDPLMMETILNLTIPGDMAISFEVPAIATPDKLYVKIPNIPMFPLGEAAGKFLEIDPKEYAEQQGIDIQAIDFDLQRKFGGDVMDIVFKHLDAEPYFEELKKSDVEGLPDDLKADRYVKFSITQDSFESFVMTAVDHIVPEVIDLLLESEEYRAMLGVTEDELRRAKDELAAEDRSGIRQDLEELKESFRINELSLTGAIRDKVMVYQKVNVRLETTQDGETMKIGLGFDIRYDNINGDVQFEHGVPNETITMDELIQSFMLGTF